MSITPGSSLNVYFPLVIIDASTIDLCLSLYDWAKFRRQKGAVKLHLMLKILQMPSTLDRSLSNLAARLLFNLLTYRELWVC